MPELPEVETSVQAIQEFADQSLESIEIYNLPSKSFTNTHSFRDDRNTENCKKRVKFLQKT